MDNLGDKLQDSDLGDLTLVYGRRISDARISWPRKSTKDAVTVVYRKQENGGLGHPLTIEKPAASNFLIIKTPPSAFGKIFISYKDDEDLELAKSLFAIARRAGFEPYLAPPDRKPRDGHMGSEDNPRNKDLRLCFYNLDLRNGEGHWSTTRDWLL